ncbi:MAG TPA: hypothetical protein DCQ98_16895 [Planctomycetaceae bacterium]|nr:hypothetical protein [Planctomycetaceae bacterium]
MPILGVRSSPVPDRDPIACCDRLRQPDSFRRWSLTEPQLRTSIRRISAGGASVKQSRVDRPRKTGAVESLSPAGFRLLPSLAIGDHGRPNGRYLDD